MIDTPLDLLYNPRAGRGSAARRIDSVVAEFAEAGVPVRAIASTAPRDIEARARSLAESGAPCVLVAGGDGSVHEAVNGILDGGGGPALGLVPLGTGNDFAKANGIPRDAEAAAARLAVALRDGKALRRVDVGRLNGRWFANSAGIGFDARVSTISRRIRLPLGPAVYLLALARALVDGVPTPPLTLEHDGGRHEGPLTLASFNIGRWVGGLFPLAPDALNDDGLFDLVYADALTRLGILRLLPRLLAGTHAGDPAVHVLRVTSCRVRAAAPIVAHLDGELLSPRRDFDLSITPGALEIL